MNYGLLGAGHKMRKLFGHDVAATALAPYDHLGAGALAAVLVTVGVGLLFLRASTALDELRTT